MKKVAYTNTGDLLSGLGTWGLAGAGLGAAGAGAATAMSPNDEHGKHKSILKSMFLGGALGGVTGAGARAGADYFDPALAADPGFGGATLNKPTATENPRGFWGGLKDTVAWSPGGSGVVAGIGTAGVSGRIQARAAKERDINVGKLKEDFKEKINLANNRMTRAVAGVGAAPTAPTAPGQNAPQQMAQEYQQALLKHQQALQQHQSDVTAARAPHAQMLADSEGELEKITDADKASRSPSALRGIMRRPLTHGLGAFGLVAGLGYPERSIQEDNTIFQNSNQTPQELGERLSQALQTAKQ